MKKRVLSILLCVCMVLSLLQMPALAETEHTISIGGVEVDNNDWYALTDTNGTVTTKGAISTNSNIHVKLGDVDGKPTATVTLKNATIANLSNMHAINVTGYDLNIVLEGTTNQIGTDETSYGKAIYSSTENNVTISGEGDLTLKGYYGINVNGVGDVNINTTGNLNIVSNMQMVYASGNLTVSAKSIEATGYYFYGNAVSLTATDGNIHVTGSYDYGINASGKVTAMAPNGEISVSGTKYAIYASNYLVNVAAKNDVTITGTVNSKEVSVTSETGNLTINGYYKAIEGAQTSVTLSAPSGDMLLNSSRESIIAGSNNYILTLTAGKKLEAKGPYGIQGYGSAIIKAEKVSVSNNTTGYTFNGGVFTITNPSGGNCSEVYISGGHNGMDVINAWRDVNIKADKVMIIAGPAATHAINASSINGDVTVTIGDNGLIVGAIYIKGTNAISEGVLHAEKNGINASYGLNLNKNTPSQTTYYKAGDGYVIFEPKSGETPATLLLHNATIHNGTTWIDNVIGMENEGIALPTGNIIIKVEGTNSITSSYGDGMGYLGSHVTLAGSGILTVDGNAGDIKLDDGAFSFADGTDVTLNGVVSVRNDDTPQNTDTVYGNMTVGTYFRQLYRDVIIAEGTNVTIPEGQTFWMNETDSITINGQIVNNGTIFLPYNYTIEQIQALNLTGNLLLRDSAENNNRIYVNGNIYEYGGKVDYDFSLASAPTEVTYYDTINGYFIFTPASGETQAKLDLHNVDLLGKFKLPNVPLTFHLEGENTIEEIDASASITIEGSGKLDVYDFKNSNEHATLTVNNGAKLNTKYKKTAGNMITTTIYGSCSLWQGERFDVSPSDKLVLSSGAVLTLQEDANLEFQSGATLDDVTFGTGASIVNKSHITLPQGTTMEQIKALPITGTGAVRVATAYNSSGEPSAWDTCTQDGKKVVAIEGELKLTETEVLEADNKGYTWIKSINGDNELWTLTLKNNYINGNVMLPNKPVLIHTTEESFINGSINAQDSNGYSCALNATFAGTAPLNINGGIYGGVDGDTVTVQEGAKVTVDGSIFLGASGGANGTLNITGTGTMFYVSSSMGYAVMCDSVNVQNGAAMTVKSQGEGSIGVEALTGVSITGGSTLTAGCDYGVYIIGGKLEVETGSKLITNGALAPFCVVDTTHTKSQGEVVSLPGIPEGTGITQILGTDTHSDTGIYQYWSLVSTGSILGVSNENNTPVTLSGAFIGLATFQSNLNEAEITVSGTYTYNGAAQIPDKGNVIVTLNSGNHTVDSSNYDITASNNINAGTATVTVTAKGSSDYAGTKSTSFTINKAEQGALSINGASGKKNGDSPFNLSTTGGNGTGNVSYVSSDPTILSISGSTATIHKVGTVTITATKVADTNYNEAKTTMSLTISDSGSNGGNNNGSGNSGGSNQGISYKLIFETNGGSKISDVTKSSGTVIDLNEYKSTRAGFKFDGWYTDEALTGKVAEIKLDKNATIYAKWIATSENPFSDVVDNSYYHDSVLWAVKEGITSGTTANTFSPEMITTRAQMVTFLWRSLGMPETTLANSKFNDMDKDAYYYKAVLWAEENNVTTGTSATTFSPENKVTRGQVASFLWRLDGKPSSANVNPFVDIQSGMYYYDAILWAVEKGITYGTSETKYSPDDPCLRAQTVTFLYRKIAD